MKFDKNKFVFKELFINSEDGKTSSSGFAGTIGFLVGLVCFLYGVYAYHINLPGANELMGHIIAVLGISAGLLGVRKIWNSKETKKEEGMDV